MSILAGFIGALCCYAVMKYKQKFIVEPTYAEFGRMSKLIWYYDWNFCLMDGGSTYIYKAGESTTHIFCGDWMYKLLKKDRPNQERVPQHYMNSNK